MWFTKLGHARQHPTESRCTGSGLRDLADRSSKLVRAARRQRLDLRPVIGSGGGLWGAAARSAVLT